jgi:hypothetical protein
MHFRHWALLKYVCFLIFFRLFILGHNINYHSK